MEEKSVDSARGAGGSIPWGKKERFDDLRKDGTLHPNVYVWVMQNKFKPGEDIPQRLIDIYRRSIKAWDYYPLIYTVEYGDRRSGPYVV